MGLVDEISEEPEQSALEWARTHLSPRSASSLRHATRAARFEFMTRFDALIKVLESTYLGELMDTNDAVEGIQAFLEKRKPEWQNA